jgi:uncharacterized ubiquitin-like protein YukD
MDRITIEFISDALGRSYDLSVPGDIRADALIESLNEAYQLGMTGERCLISEHPRALLGGGATLAECGIRNGSVVHHSPGRKPLEQ